jgi:hypothetical protein
MIGKLALAMLALLASVSLAFAGDPVGSYAVAGANPGTPDNQYRLGPEDRRHLVIWNIGSQTFTGTGIAKENDFSVTYRSGGLTGLAVYSATGDNWDGTWTFTDSHRTGTESWTRK